MPRAAVIGGGLAGLAATAALAEAGFHVDLFEARGFLGGRATSYPLSPADPDSETIDNCQHILLGCCVNLLDFYRRLGVLERIRFYSEFCFLEPGGRLSRLKPGCLPAPFHFAASFARLPFLRLADKLAIARGLWRLRKERRRRGDLDRITMLDWLREKRQTPGAVERFWGPVLVSAVNETTDRMAALHGFQVFSLGFLSSPGDSALGVPDSPLGTLYGAGVWSKFRNVTLHLRAPVERVKVEGDQARTLLVGGQNFSADYYLSCLPFERVGAVIPDLGLDLSAFEHSPITGIHLWFDRPVTDLPQAALLGRTLQWFFNKSEGRYLQLVVSASRSLVNLSRNEVVALAARELGEFLPEVRAVRIVKAHVVKELHATFSARPGLEALRPQARTRIRNLFLAGDWTRSGWPATMEGAVRSGYLAAEALTAAAGHPRSFLVG